jgi:hypothetical protein
MMEVDRVLRPGGYWVLSGPPINWKVNYKGWQRTKKDLEAEQNKIDRSPVNRIQKQLYLSPRNAPRRLPFPSSR